MFTVHDERCSKTGKHAPLQAGRGVGVGDGDGTGRLQEPELVG